MWQRHSKRHTAPQVSGVTMNITKDQRTILHIIGDGDYFGVGSGNCTLIEAYDELGEMGYVPWFKVWNGTKLIARVNSKYVKFVYYLGE